MFVCAFNNNNHNNDDTLIITIKATTTTTTTYMPVIRIEIRLISVRKTINYVGLTTSHPVVYNIIYGSMAHEGSTQTPTVNASTFFFFAPYRHVFPVLIINTLRYTIIFRKIISRARLLINRSVPAYA